MHDLFSHLDPDTSRQAAKFVVDSGTVAGQEAIMLRLVKDNPGKTSDELGELAFKQTGNHKHDRFMAARRLAGLKNRGLVRQGDARISNVGGRRGVTWYAIEQGN